MQGALCFVEAIDGGIAFDVVGEAGQDVCGQIVLVVARDGRGLHGSSLCEVHEEEVGIVVPDVEDAKLSLGEHQPAAVG